jgi:hypothetical protein
MATTTCGDAIAGAATDAPKMVGSAGRVFAKLLLLHAHAASIGLRSGNYGGGYSRRTRWARQAGRTRASWCAARLSMTKTSPARRRGDDCRVSHATKRSALFVANIVCGVTSRALANRPEQGQRLPQFIGMRSTYSVPRFTQVCVRYIATCRPDSSRNTRRSAGFHFLRPAPFL